MPLIAGLAGGFVVGLLGWLAIAAGWIEADSSAQPASVAAPRALSDPAADGEALSPGEVYDRAGPAVAYIEAEQSSPQASPFGPLPDNGGTATGSGFLIDDSGHVLTNAHVVDGSDAITVKLGEDGETLDAKLLGSDTSTDVAVLRVDPDKVTAAPLQFANSDQAKVGDPVVAIGNPFGLDRTVTAGIVSALQREISAPDGFTISDVIQTDASINPGNSGGPLLDASGKVIGINSQIATAGGGGSVGVGFAVPINTAKTVSAQILEDGTADHAFLGISGADLTAKLASVLNLDVEEGVLVQEVTPDSPAADAGLRGGEATIAQGGAEIRIGGDIITAVDGESVSDMESVAAVINRKQPGDEVSIDFVRNGDTKHVTVKLGDRPAQAGS
jgi:S1-C subfamily serine protease